MSKKYEFSFVDVDTPVVSDRKLEEKLRVLGLQGWRVVASIGRGYEVILEREIRKQLL